MRIEPITVEMAQKHKTEIAQLYFENVQSSAFYDHYTFEDAYQKMDDLIGHLANGTAIVYGAFDSENVIAFIWAYIHQFREETRMYISEIRVNEEYRKQGIGKELLKQVEDKAKELGLGAMYLHAEARNKDARRLYETCGYCEERIQMRKELVQSLI